jgi:adenylyl-sulfate kinase
MTPANIVPHQHTLSLADRRRIKGHRPAVLWFTGLSGSGKSTVANAVEALLCEKYQAHTYLLDGDNIRSGLNKDLGFSKEDRHENIRRLGEVCKLFHDAGIVILTAFISPFAEDRNHIRDCIPAGDFIEIYVDCPLEVCENRDPKGLYKKARAGEIKQFTGVDAEYEVPLHPEIIINTASQFPDDCAAIVVQYLDEHQFITKSSTTEQE